MKIYKFLLITTILVENIFGNLYKYQEKSFAPDIYITHKVPEDKVWYNKIKPFFYEYTPQEGFFDRFTKLLFNQKPQLTGNNKRYITRERAKQIGAQELFIKTEDNLLISSLYFKRPNAPVNIIYVTGFFEQATPLKEWGTPFAALFPEFNIFTFDWRGFGHSSGTMGRVFGTNAYKDILAIIDFIKKDNNKPIVLVGFCMGGAMCLHAINMAQKYGYNIPDAIVLNSPFTKFEYLIEKAAQDPDLNIIQWIIVRSKWAQNLHAKQFKGNLFDLKPIELIKNITIPCLVEHSTHDKFSPIEMGISIYKEATCPKMFLKSEFGKHVRIHTSVPFQYREAFIKFLTYFNLLKYDSTIN